jgi:hypothetical protein
MHFGGKPHKGIRSSWWCHTSTKEFPAEPVESGTQYALQKQGVMIQRVPVQINVGNCSNWPSTMLNHSSRGQNDTELANRT